MKYFRIRFSFFFLGNLFMMPLTLMAQQEKKYIYHGNELYKAQKFKEAENDYRQSLTPTTVNSLEGNFNLGDALFKQKKYEDAGNQFNKIASTQSNPLVKADAFHNLGNAYLSNKKLKESVDAYEKSLINNPNDNSTRYNLAYAKKLLKNQENQKKKDDKDNKDKNNKDKNKDQNKDPNKDPNKDQNKDPNKNQNKDQKDPNKDPNKDQENQNQNNKDQQNPNNGGQNQLSKEDAQRMLDELNREEQNTRNDQQKKVKANGQVHISKNW